MQRRLSPAEMAQIAGRAGRHQRDGTFGSILDGSDSSAFLDSEIERIETHSFSPVRSFFWRNASPQFGSIEKLIASLEQYPLQPNLKAAPEAIDLKVLKRLAQDEDVKNAATDNQSIARLWEVCGLPDFRQSGAAMHAHFVTRLFQWLKDPNSCIPENILKLELQKLDSDKGDIASIAARLAATRTWTYATQRRNWSASTPAFL